MKVKENISKQVADSAQININRRAFLIKSGKCSACLAFLPYQKVLAREPILEIKSDVKKVFLKKGTCSQTFFFLLNREFGNNKAEEERAADPLAGGILQKGYQCGLLLGSALAVGSESFRRNNNENVAIAKAIKTSQHLLASFIDKVKTPNCKELTNVDFSKRLSILKLVLFKTKDCLGLADKWAPKAFHAAHKGLAEENPEQGVQNIMSCSTEVARRMGASKEEMITVSGLAGGLGLSGNACGALCAAIWLNSLYGLRQNPSKSAQLYDVANETLNDFEAATGGEFLCSKITQKQFNTIREHSEYIECGGCNKIIDILALTKGSTC